MTHADHSDKRFPFVDDLCVATLAERVSGQICQAEMPCIGGCDEPIGRIVTDCRAIEPGDVFWAVGDREESKVEAAYEAFMRGAAGVVAEQRVEPWSGRWSIRVADANLALATLAHSRRATFNGQAIAVTGSVGKSTALRMMDAVLATRMVGTTTIDDEPLPLSVLRLDPEDEYALFELQANKTVDVQLWTRLVAPQIGVITNVADANLGSFGSRLALAEAQTNLVRHLPADGLAILPGDDPWVRRFARQCACRIIWFGRRGDCDVNATDVESHGGALRFKVDGVRIAIPVWGRHHLGCALAAFAVGRVFGYAPTEIAQALSEFEPLPRRCEVVPAGSFTIIDDSYGASPSGMRAALQLLRNFEAPGRRVAVFGDLSNVGDAAGTLHEQLGDEAVSLCGADLIVACGEHARETVSGARAAGMPQRRAIACRLPEEAATALAQNIAPGDIVLLKGDRQNELSQLLRNLQPATLRRVA